MIILGIPSGQRADRLGDVLAAWRKLPVKIALLTWDDETEKRYADKVDFFFRTPERRSFACNHNQMMAALEGWQGYICGADDLYPGTVDIDRVAVICKLWDGHLLWVHDGLNNVLMTHPVVTPGYLRAAGGKLFDERFEHNYCDTDLMVTAAGKIVKMAARQFDHRWHKTGMDAIYEFGSKTFATDRQRFIEKHGNAHIQYEDIVEVA
jgi:hypothetical protein